MVWQSKSRVLSSIASLFCLVSLSVTANSQVVLLDFNSIGCGPCQQMRPTVQRLAAAGYDIRHIDIGREPSIAAQHHVDRVPTFIALLNGQEVARITGFTSYENIVQMLDEHRYKIRGQSPQASANRTSPTNVPPSSSAERAFHNPNMPQLGDTPAVQNPVGSPSSYGNVPDEGSPVPRTPEGQLLAPIGSVAGARDLLEATVKIAVEDPEGVSAGTGTIIDTQDGAALVLTCGHLFRSSNGRGKITVTLFGAAAGQAQQRESVAGQLLHFDLERDLALLIIRPQSPVAERKLGVPGSSFAPGQTVRSVGCNQGANPTVVQSRITSVNRYQGPSNVQVAGAPVEGRSGGGLFDASGRLIGVCFAADPQAKEGLYCALSAIVEQLDELNLSMVYRDLDDASLAQVPGNTSAVAASPELNVRGQDAFPEVEMSTSSPFFQIETTLSDSERAALEEIQRRGSQSEVICIIRPLDATGKSEVITLNSVSPQFVAALTRFQTEATGQNTATAAAGRLLDR